MSKVDDLKKMLKDMNSVAVAFSGGVDSTYLLKVAHDVLGDRCIAVTALSPSFPDSENDEAREFCESEGIKQVFVNPEEYKVEEYAVNPPNRCYYCKHILFSGMKKVAEEYGCNYILEGTNADDINDYRPGMKAIEELGVRSPLRETGFTKEEIRQESNLLELPTWDKPSFVKRPSDTVNDHIIFEIHTYPNIVKTDANNNVTGTRPLSDIKTEIEDMISGIKTHLMAKGAPVIFGEWGTSNVDGAETDYVAHRDMLLLFVDYFVKQTKQAGIGTFFWMGLSDGSVRTLPAFNQPDLAEAIVKAYHGNSYEGKYPKESDFNVEFIVNYMSEWSEVQLFSGSAPLATYVGARLEMSELPEAGTLKIKCYGDANGREQYDELSTNSLNTTITFRQSEVGEKVTRITLQTFVGPTTAKIRRTMLIRHDGTEVEYKPSVFWGCDVTSASVSDIIQPFVSSDDTWKPVYNLYGQRISVPDQGIYVRGGRKFVVF